ncbi:hypothetical protein [Agromyces bracchium]|uniref:Uncharacterized protein n=1 Tax=Agromyces bracchium TaxID=88376 RepID=A0A6I3M7Z3_9MICO|nr:hypothetical protein [Agromyces bracchium]MTH68232.1 hypothetical protein [Agromyces bracchium]
MPPTPSPSPLQVGATDLTPWIALAGTIFASLLALAGVIVLFWLQRNAVRKGERQRAQDEAFERLSAIFARAAEAASSGDVPKLTAVVNVFVMRVSEAIWYIDTSDEYVADWIVERVQRLSRALIDEPDLTKRGDILKSAHRDLTVVLRHWRYGTIPTRNFSEWVKHLD